MVTVALLIVSYCFVAAALLYVPRRWGERMPRWAWIVNDFVPLLLTFLGFLIASYAFQGLVKLELNKKGLGLLWAGVQLMVAIPALFWGRAGAVFGGAWLALWGVLILGDVWYFRFFGSLPSVLAIGSGGNIWAIRDSAMSVMKRADLVLLPVVGAGIGLAVFWRGKRVIPQWARGVSTVLLALCLWLGSQPVRKNVSDWMDSRHSWKVFSAGRSVGKLGLWATVFRDAARSAREIKQTKELTPERIAEVKKYHQKLRGKRGNHFGHAKGANVLIVQVEAMQQWALDAKVDGQKVMPFLSRLKKKSVYFDNIWDLTGGSPTSDCEYMVLNSQHPIPRGAVAFRRATNHFTTVPKIMKERGYVTFSGHAYERTMWNRSVLHPRYGFEQSDFKEEYGKKPKMGWGLSDGAFLERSVDRIKKLDQPWFSFLITLTSHHPYGYIPKKNKKIKVAPDFGDELGGYLHSMRYVDDTLRRLFKRLKKKGMAENTLVVIYGDHDSKLKFGGDVVKAALRDLNLDERTVHELSRREFSTKKIPLLFVPPKTKAFKRFKGEVVHEIGGQVDIGPTILDWMGEEVPVSFIGQVLAKKKKGKGRCLGCNEVGRHDGSAAGGQLIWQEATEVCSELKTGQKVDKKRCKPMRDRVAKELSISWDLTMHDLAQRVNK